MERANSELPVELIEELRAQLHETVDRRIDALLSGQTTQTESRSLPLDIHPSVFKGKRPLSVSFPDGRVVETATWKKAVSAILADCNSDPVKHDRLMSISGKVLGRDRVLLGDKDGIPRHAHARSSNSFGKPFRINIEGSDPRYSFHHIGTDDKLYVFEAPIDMLSYITMNPRDWREHSYVACCGTSIQPVIQTGAQMDCQKATVFLCLDNDKAGNMASERMAEEFGKAGIRTVRVAPRLKDWNDDLVAQQSQEVRPSWPVMCGP